MLDLMLPRLALDEDAAADAPHARAAADFVTPGSSPRPAAPSPFARLGLLSSPVSLGRRRLDAFDIDCLIGKGGFGKVFKVRHKASLHEYAMKVMEKHVLIQRKAVQDAHSERNILAMVGQLHTNFIVRLHTAFQTSKRVYLVMDLASGGELMWHLRRECMLPENHAKFYAAELLCALDTLHNMQIIHRDIKPENVLLDAEGHLVLTDFGLAKELVGSAEQTHSWCGSEDYMAPEVVARASHTGKPADFWAYGVFIYDILCGEPPFSPLHEKGNLTRKRLHDRILKCKYKLPGFLTPACHSLLRKLMTKDPAKRLTDAAEIRAHPWFSGIDWDLVRAKKVVPPMIPPSNSPTACFSPSLTKVDHSAPHSPGSVAGSPTRAIPVAAAGGNNSSNHAPAVADVWQGFSFVAPDMEVHFQLAPPAVERPASYTSGGSFSLAVVDALAAHSPDLSCDAHNEAALSAELAEFSLDAAEAVEIFDGSQV